MCEKIESGCGEAFKFVNESAELGEGRNLTWR